MKVLFLIFAILNATTIWAMFLHETGTHLVERSPIDVHSANILYNENANRKFRNFKDFDEWVTNSEHIAIKPGQTDILKLKFALSYEPPTGEMTVKDMNEMQEEFEILAPGQKLFDGTLKDPVPLDISNRARNVLQTTQNIYKLLWSPEANRQQIFNILLSYHEESGKTSEDSTLQGQIKFIKEHIAEIAKSHVDHNHAEVAGRTSHSATRDDIIQAIKGLRDEEQKVILITLMEQHGVGRNPAERQAAIKKAQGMNMNQIIKVMRGMNTRRAIFQGITSTVMIIMLAVIISLLQQTPNSANNLSSGNINDDLNSE